MNRTILTFLSLLAVFLSSLSSSPAEDGTGHIVERIEIRGNERTRERIIIRTVGIIVGEPLGPHQLKSGRDALYRTRLFRTVHVSAKPGSTPGAAIVLVYVEETRFGNVGVSVEYTELDGFGLSADVYHANLLGESKVAGAEYGSGERIKFWGFRYANPWTFGTNQSSHLQVSGSLADRDLFRSKDPDARGQYDIERIGGTLGLGQPMFAGRYRAILNFSLESVDIRNVQIPTVPTGDGAFGQELEAAAGRETVSAIGVEFRRRAVRQPWGSTPGFDLKFQASFSGKALGSISDFLRIRTEVYRHLEVLPGQILTLGGKAGAILGTPPFYERFFLDGDNQLRGYERREIGPEGGTLFYLTEVVYSISLHQLGRAYAFAESAGVRRTLNGRARRESDAAVGIGLLLFNRIDISVGLNTDTLIVKKHRFGGINIHL